MSARGEWARLARRMRMPSDLDLYRAASVLIDHHGADALYVAAARADEFLRKGNAETSGVWDSIAIAVQRSV